MRGVETEWRKAWEAGRPVLGGLEVILQIRRLGGHFCGDHGASAPTPSYYYLVLSVLSRESGIISVTELIFLKLNYFCDSGKTQFK